MSNAIAQRQYYEYLNNTCADVRLLGWPTIMCPFAQHTSASRLTMLDSHLQQALILDGAEFPRIFTGFEREAGKYTFNSSRRTEDAIVLKVIPKYHTMRGDMPIKANPSFTIIYRGDRSGKLCYCTVERYTMGSNGYGYENVWHNQHVLHSITDAQSGVYLPKELLLQSSPALKGEKYCLGLNLNVCFMTLPETIEDAMYIGRSAAERMQTTELYQRSIIIRADQLPLNLYGDELDYKFMPDIGEFVDERGYLMALRPMNNTTYAADGDPQALREVQPANDVVLHVPPGVEIVDIDVHAHPKARLPGNVYGQAEKYRAGSVRYWKAIVAAYQENRKVPLSPAFNTLATTAISRLIAAGERVPGVSFRNKVELNGRNGRPIRFLQIDVTYMRKRPLKNGFKISDRFGGRNLTH